MTDSLDREIGVLQAETRDLKEDLADLKAELAKLKASTERISNTLDHMLLMLSGGWKLLTVAGSIFAALGFTAERIVNRLFGNH